MQVGIVFKLFVFEVKDSQALGNYLLLMLVSMKGAKLLHSLTTSRSLRFYKK